MSNDLSSLDKEINGIDEALKEIKDNQEASIYAKHKKNLAKIQMMADAKKKPISINVSDYQKIVAQKMKGKGVYYNKFA